MWGREMRSRGKAEAHSHCLFLFADATRQSHSTTTQQSQTPSVSWALSRLSSPMKPLLPMGSWSSGFWHRTEAAHPCPSSLKCGMQASSLASHAPQEQATLLRDTPDQAAAQFPPTLVLAFNSAPQRLKAASAFTSIMPVSLCPGCCLGLVWSALSPLLAF